MPQIGGVSVPPQSGGRGRIQFFLLALQIPLGKEAPQHVGGYGDLRPRFGWGRLIGGVHLRQMGLNRILGKGNDLVVNTAKGQAGRGYGLFPVFSLAG
jgi:hypothetical protein